MIRTQRRLFLIDTAVGQLTYLLRDDFTIDDAAPWANPHICDVVGTMATSQVVQQFSSAAGLWVIPAQAIPAWGDLAAWDSIGRTRVAGLAMFAQANLTTSAICTVGWDNDQAGIVGEIAFYWTIAFMAVAPLNQEIAPALAINTDYEFTVVLRAIGAYLYARGGIYGTTWRLLFVDNTSNTATNYAAISNWNAVLTSDTFRVAQLPPSDIQHPTLSDNFSVLATSDGLGHLEADGYGAGHTYAGMSGASVAGNALYNNPPLDVELLVDGDMEAATTAAWAYGSGGVLSKQAGTRPGGGGALVLQVLIPVADAFGRAQQNAITQGQLVRATGWGIGDGVNGAPALQDGAGVLQWTGTTVAAWQSFDVDFIAPSSVIPYKLVVVGNVATQDIAQFDDCTLNELALADVLRLSDLSGLTEPYSEIDLTVEVGRLQGLALCWDDDANPASGILVYSNTTRSGIRVDKYITGTLTQLANIAFTYAAGTTLVARLEGTRLRLWYNRANIGNVPVADAQITSNTLHGYLHTGGAASFQTDGITYDTDRGSRYNRYFVGA